MAKRFSFSILILAIALILKVKAQDTTALNIDRTVDTMLLVNGKNIICKVVENSDGYIYYETETDIKIRYKAIPIEDIFSIKYANDSLVIIYGKDSIASDDYSVQEMDAYIKGEQFAIANYKSPFSTMGGIAFGAVGAYFIPFYGLGIISPGIYTASISLSSTKPKNADYTNIDLKNYPFYNDGYSAVANKKKIGNALKGSLVGMSLLLLVNLALQAK